MFLSMTEEYIQTIFLKMIKHKTTGVNFWKPFFNDLNPFDTLDIEDVLKRYKDTICSFDQCKKQEEAGHYFLRITDDQLTDPLPAIGSTMLKNCFIYFIRNYCTVFFGWMRSFVFSYIKK